MNKMFLYFFIGIIVFLSIIMARYIGFISDIAFFIIMLLFIGGLATLRKKLNISFFS